MINLFDKNQNHFNNIKSNIDQIQANSFSDKTIYQTDGNQLFRRKKNSAADRNIIKHKFSELIDKARAFSTDILKRNKTTYGKKRILKNSSKSIDIDIHNINSRIKKQSLFQRNILLST